MSTSCDSLSTATSSLGTPLHVVMRQGASRRPVMAPWLQVPPASDKPSASHVEPAPAYVDEIERAQVVPDSLMGRAALAVQGASQLCMRSRMPHATIISSILHATVFASMLGWVVSEQLSTQPPVTLVASFVSHPSEEPLKIETLETPVTDLKPKLAIDAKPIAQLASAGYSTNSLGGDPTDAPLAAVGARRASTLGGMGEFGDGLLTSIGDGNGDPKSEVKPPSDSATFFGIRAKGKKFVFVVDCSGSMSADGRLLRAQDELIRSLMGLGYDQEFYIVFFNHLVFPMPGNKLVAANGKNLRDTTEWIRHSLPIGGTVPWPGLAIGLDLKPDAIFLMTDGEFSPDAVDRLAVRGATGDRIPIHTIAFASRAGEELLMAIARFTKGTYRFVP